MGYGVWCTLLCGLNTEVLIDIFGGGVMFSGIQRCLALETIITLVYGLYYFKTINKIPYKMGFFILDRPGAAKKKPLRCHNVV